MRNDVVYKSGFAQVFVLLGMLVVSVALPVATKLVQQNQENRSNAREVEGATTNSKQTIVKPATSTKSTSTSTSTTAKTAAAKAKTTTTTSTCKYKCKTWGACSSGWQTCTTDEKLSTSPFGCTGGRKVGIRQKCATTTTKKADGSTCGSNSECTSGYCNLTIKKCATKVITCTYICNKWSTCTDGKQTCIEDKKVTATACSGGRKVNTTQNCKTSTTSKMWYYFNGTSCVGKAYDSATACITVNKACFTTYDVCAKNNTPSSSTTTTAYYYYNESKKTCTPTTSLNACKSITCYSSLPSCQLAHIKMWYYFNGTSCVGKAYGSSDACKAVNKTCYDNYNACLKANPPSNLTSEYWYYKEGTGCVETSRTSCQSVVCYSSNTSCNESAKNRTIKICNYECKTWGTCVVDSSSNSGATQTCLDETKTPDNCIGGITKIGTTRNCTFGCASKGGKCVSKCDLKNNHVIYAYGKSNNGIGSVGGCSNGQVCCVDNNVATTSCTEGNIECRSNPKWKNSYELYTCSSGKMIATGKKCLISGDKVFYGADVPKNWISNRDRAKNPMPADIDLTPYQTELMKRIDEAGGPGTRAAVAAAALYLAEEFPYTIPYQSGGGDAETAITSPGFQLTIKDDGTPTYTAPWDDKNGLNCTGLTEWAYRAAGFSTGLKNASTQEVTTYSGNSHKLTSDDSSSKDQAKLDTIKIGDLMYDDDGDIVHVALITDIDYASGTVQIVQSSSGAGVNVEYMDLFTLQNTTGTGSENNFRVYTHIGDGYFEQEPGLLNP